MELAKSSIQVNEKVSILLRYLSVSLLFGVLLESLMEILEKKLGEGKNRKEEE